MPNVSFDQIRLNQSYSRTQLTELWGYESFQAIARGVVTPAHHPYIILFVTHEKQASATQYRDHLDGNRLLWEGPMDHYAEARMMNAASCSDEIHIFYRARHHTDFVYMGQAEVEQAVLASNTPSRFVLKLITP